MDCIIHNTGCSKLVIRTVVREGNLIPTRQYLLISYNSYISKLYFSCLFLALLLVFFSQDITSKLVKAFLYKLYSSAIFFQHALLLEYFSHGKSSFAQSIEEEAKTDDPRIPNRFKKQDSRSSQNDHIR